MVAVIKTGHSIKRLLNYNEHKVTEGVARLLTAENYPIDAERMGFSQKLNRLTKQAALNENVSRNSVHISLNFHPSEVLTDEQMKHIAGEYMQGIGFAEQPYLVYRHWDAGHPHIHLVSVKVRADGRRIETQNIGRDQSRKTAELLEKKYGLMVAKGRKAEQQLWLKPIDPQRATYGKTETKRAMANVLLTVVNDYKYASLAELNAVLRSFNLVADRGTEDSRIFKNKGLVYQVLNEHGERIGVPVKASDFSFNPGLKFLETKFNQCVKNEDSRRHLRQRINWALLKPGLSLAGLAAELKAEGIDMVVRRNDDGVVYGLTYVDHGRQCVFNGSALGKAYSAKAIVERCLGLVAGEGKKQDGEWQRPRRAAGADGDRSHGFTGAPGAGEGRNVWPGRVVDALLDPGDQPLAMDWELKRRKRKKKRRLSPG